ncbi:MAG: SGNH/GDSL hydrolase family protein [Arenicella sp.]
MNIFKTAFLVTLLTSVIAACGGGGTSSSSSTNVSKVLAVGDSIGNGYGGVSAWPDLVRARTGYNVVNYSQGGRHAAYSVSTVRFAIDREQPSHLIIMLGTNDSNRGSVSGATSAMQQIVEYARARNVVPIVGTVPPRNSKSRQISANYRAIGAPIADIEAAFGSGSGLFQADGVHPNNAGQDVIANTFISALKAN